MFFRERNKKKGAGRGEKVAVRREFTFLGRSRRRLVLRSAPSIRSPVRRFVSGKLALPHFFSRFIPGQRPIERPTCPARNGPFVPRSTRFETGPVQTAGKTLDCRAVDDQKAHCPLLLAGVMARVYARARRAFTLRVFIVRGRGATDTTEETDTAGRVRDGASVHANGAS